MIRIFEHDSTVFTSLGLGDITKIVTKAQSVETLNGQYSLELDIVYDKWGKWKLLTNGRIIYADGQAFRIYATRKKQSGFTAYARHIFWDLMDNEVRDARPTDKNAMAAMQDILDGTNYAHNFTAFSDILTTNTQYYINRNPVDCLIGTDSLRTRWGGELKLDNFEVSMLGQRGQDNGVQIAYRKNMQDIDVEESYEGFITRLRPKGNNGLELPEVYIDSPYIGNYPHPVIREVSFFIDAADYSTQAEAEAALRAAANAYYASTKCDIPAVSIDVDLVLLENTTQYAAYRNLVAVALGDTVTCRHLDLEIDHTARVVKITKDLLTGKNARVEIGQLKKRINNSFTRIKNALTDISTVVENNKTSLQQAIDDATAVLTSALGGYVYKRNGEILIMDTEDPVTCAKVWRFNLNGLGYSSTGINGPYGIAMTMDGKINASFITTGELDAAIIKVGSIEADKLSIAAKQVLFEMVDVGATNLLENSEAERTSVVEYIGVGIYDILMANLGKEITFSFDLKSAVAGPIGVYALGDFEIGYTYFDATTAYQRFSITVVPVKVGTAGWSDWSFYGVYGSGRIPSVRKLKIEIGNVVTDWSPHPKELYSGILRADKNGLNVGISTSDINTQVAYDGLKVKDGATDIASFGAAGAVTPNLQATNITGNVENTIDTTTLAIGTGYAYSTITSALASLGNKKLLNGTLTLNLYGAISDIAVIDKFKGKGGVDLRFQSGAVLNGALEVNDCSCRVGVQSVGATRGTIKRTSSAHYAPLNLLGNNFVYVADLNLDGNGGSYGINCYAGHKGMITGCDIVNAAQGIRVNSGSVVSVLNCKGNVSDTGLYAILGGVIFAYGTIPNGISNGTFKSSGFIIAEGTLTETNSSYSPPASTPTVFVGTFVPTSIKTYNHDTSTIDTTYGDNAAQGKWYTMSYWKDAVLAFDSDIYNYWQGGYNVTVEMRLRRKNSTHGTSSGVAPVPYNFSPSEAFNAVARGAWTDWTTVPSSVFGSGGATLKFYSSVLDSGYAIWDACEVRVTVTKDV